MFKNISEFNESYRIHSIINLYSINFQLYIDSRDLLGMISGLKSLTQHGKFNEKEFTDENTLIRALIFEKKIKNFKILIPHEDEVFYNLERYKTIYNVVSNEEKDEILYYFENIIGISIKDFFEKKDTQILRALEKNGKQLFIVKYLLDNNNWQQRLKYLWKHNIYQSDNERYDYEKIINSDLFKKLLNSFNNIRSNLKNSNIVDSIILCILHEKIQLYEKSGGAVPFFYDSTFLFKKIIEEPVVKDNYKFKIKIHNIEVDIIQNHSFFLLSALFSIKDPKLAITDENYEEYKKYKEIIKDFNLNSNDKIDNDSLEQINRYINKKFLTLFWRSYENESIKFFKRLRKFLNDNPIKQQIESDITDIINKIRIRINYYSIYRKTYTTLLNKHKKVKKIFTNNINEIGIDNLNIFRDYGLTRFSFSRVNCQELNEITKGLFNEADEYGQLNEQLSYVGKIITNGYLKTDEQTQAKLVIGLAILWILNKYDLIIQILESHQNYFHYSLAFLHASSLAKYKNDKLKTNKAIKILDLINKKYPFIKNYKVSIGASYVYYHLWENNNDNNFRSTLREPTFCGEKNNQDCYLRKAIQLAELAIKFLEKNNFYQEEEYRKNKYYYIINNFIYYVTMGMCDEKFKILEKYVNILEDIKATDEHFWEYRFNDSLSLYYLRKGLMEKDMTMIHMANVYNKEAARIVLIEDDKNIIELTSKKIRRVTEKTLPNNVYKSLGV